MHQKNYLLTKIIAVLTTLLLSFSINCSAQTGTGKDISTIKSYLKSRTPPIDSKSITPTPVVGIYEVYAGGTIFYIDKTATFVLVGGALINDHGGKNLTEDRLQELSSIKFSALPLQNAIEIKKGSGAFKFAVFTDPDCPYCKTLELGLAKSEIEDYTAYVFLYPLEHIHPDALTKSESIWCAKDKIEAWLDWMVRGIAPPKATCDNPISINIRLAEEIGVNGTPSIYLKDGHQVNGLKDLVEKIKQSQLDK